MHHSAIQIDVKMDEPALSKKSSKMLWLLFSSKLDWSFYTVSIVKTSSKKIRALMGFTNLLSSNIALYLFRPIIQPCMEYFCYVWVVLLIATLICWKTENVSTKCSGFLICFETLNTFSVHLWISFYLSLSQILHFHYILYMHF